jgi:F-type H+-transporting ATPase subunit delta
MIQGSLSRRYAKALLDLALEENQLNALLKDLEVFSSLIENNPILLETLGNNTLPLGERKGLLREVIGQMDLSPYFGNFLKLLMDKQRILLFFTIHREFKKMADESMGILRTNLITASLLGDADQKRIQSKLAQWTGKNVVLRVNQDPELVGGMKTVIGHTIIDGTIATQLEKLKKRMLHHKKI